MTREEKNKVIDYLQSKFEENSIFYVTDSSALTVAEVNELRGLCYENGITMKVAKNTLVKKALKRLDEEGDIYKEVYDLLVGPTSIMFAEVNNAPAKVIKEFRKKHEKPVLKGAFIDKALYIGDDKVEMLSKLKSKEELIGDIIFLLQSPAKNVISALQSGGKNLAGILKTLAEREEN